MDAAYNPLCLDLSTLIPLIDGRALTLANLIDEYQRGIENWVYSCNPATGEIIKGPITWAGVTRKNADVVCVTLDNGGVVIVTPDHKFPVLGGDLIQACKLTPEHQLIARERFSHTDKNGVTRKTGHGPEHMIVHPISVVSLQDKMDVGTITVDKDEIHYPFHNFAISENIFLQNSINDDYFFAQCIHLNTAMRLLDGRTLPLADIITEDEQGKQNYVYSLNRDTHEMEPGLIAWAGITRRDAELVRVTLDNGEYVDVTPDHRFILRDGSEREAGNLKPNDSLMPLYLKEGRTGPRQKNAGYLRYVSNAQGTKTKFVHSTVCPKPSGRDYVVHHKDFNGKNNNPSNLEVMTRTDHEKLHKEIGTYSLNRQWSDTEARAKLILGMRNLYDTATPKFNQKLSKRNKKNGAGTWSKPELAQRSMASLVEARKRASDSKRLQVSDEMYTRLIELFNLGIDSISKLRQALQVDETFRVAFKKANVHVKRDKHWKEVGETIDDRLIGKIVKMVGGYKSWGEFKRYYNHKVVSVELLPYREDTGDITIESPSGSHVFALAAGVYVHNSSDGRGSKVETLPGGEQTGEITDLMFFSRKLARGLR